ncbi:hypothetical protein VPH35_137124 [Triticum aestivum]
MAAAAAAAEWFILYAIPKVAAQEDDSIFEQPTNISFTFRKAPCPSYVTVASNVVCPDGIIHYPYIAADDGRGIFLLCGYTVLGLTYYLFDPWRRRTLGVIPRVFNQKLPRFTDMHRDVAGLVRSGGGDRLMIAELNTWLLDDRGSVTIHCTVDMYGWDEKKCKCSGITAKRPWHGDGVLSHQGFLWWFGLSYCILACDPFAEVPEFYQIMFPSVPDALPFGWNRDIHRCLKVSDGQLRYVQIHGASEKPVVSIWTLSSSDPSKATWGRPISHPLDVVWEDSSYSDDARLRPGVVPAVYFFLDTYIFAIDLTKKKVVCCQEFSVGWLPPKIRTSRLVHAWQWPRPRPVKVTKMSPQSGPKGFHVNEIGLLTRWKSVEDFHNRAAIIMRSRSELQDTDLDDDSDDSDTSDEEI